jgi:hypothetical protein
MVSIICCYNDCTIYETMLYKSILKQINIEYEIVAINNSNNQFDSAADALNYGASVANGHHFIFVHQDMEFNNNCFLQSITKYLQELNNAIIGLAGRIDKEGVYTNMKNGSKNEFAGKLRVNKPTQVQTLDECLIAMNKEVYSSIKFDTNICDNWHLYGVDFCLTANKQGIKSYVVPLEAYHKSRGVLSKGFYDTLNNLVRKHRNSYPIIYSTCLIVKTDMISFNLYKIRKNIKACIKKIFFYPLVGG